jgi:hypothetical protein
MNALHSLLIFSLIFLSLIIERGVEEKVMGDEEVTKNNMKEQGEKKEEKGRQ